MTSKAKLPSAKRTLGEVLELLCQAEEACPVCGLKCFCWVASPIAPAAEEVTHDHTWTQREADFFAERNAAWAKLTAAEELFRLILFKYGTVTPKMERWIREWLGDVPAASPVAGVSAEVFYVIERTEGTPTALYMRDRGGSWTHDIHLASKWNASADAEDVWRSQASHFRESSAVIEHSWLRAKPSAEGDGWIEFVSSLLPELDAAERLAQKVDRVHGLKLAFAIRKVSNRIIERAEQPAVAKETLDVERAEKWLRNSGYVANSAGMRYIAGLLHDYSLTVARSAAEGDGWISVTPETMPPERERVLADFENHPVEISSWFQWETMEAPLWIPGVREWGRVRRWRKLPSGQGDEAIQTEREKDHCELCHGAKGGVKGNENVVGGVVLCDYCHAGWRETVWPSPHRLPRSKEKCE